MNKSTSTSAALMISYTSPIMAISRFNIIIVMKIVVT